MFPGQLKFHFEGGPLGQDDGADPGQFLDLLQFKHYVKPTDWRGTHFIKVLVNETEFWGINFGMKDATSDCSSYPSNL